MEKLPPEPVNLGSGKGTSIRELVEVILSNLDHKPKVVWDISKPSGDRKRVLDISRAKKWLGFEPEISIERGIPEVMEWYRENGQIANLRFNVFREGIPTA